MSFFGNRPSANGGGGESVTIIQGSKNNFVQTLEERESISLPKSGDICYVVSTKEIYMYQDSAWGIVGAGDLTKNTFSLKPTSQGQLEFDMPSIYNSESHVDMLFFNSIKMLEDSYSINKKAGNGYKLTLNFPAPDFESTVYNLVLIGNGSN